MLVSPQPLITIRAPKRLDSLTAPYLAQDFDTKIHPSSRIVLDLSQTQSIDPASAEVILQGLLLAKQRAAKFSLRGVNQQVQLVLAAAGVLDFFKKQPA